jgi:integrase
MSVRRRKWTDPATGMVREAWIVDVMFQHPDGRKERVRKVSPVQTKRGAEQYERELRQTLLDGTHGRKEEEEKTPVRMPTVREFADEFLETYAAVNNKPSEQASKRSMIKHHIKPLLGDLRLDEVSREIEPFKARLKKLDLSAKRINNVLACLSKMLRFAQEREILSAAPKVRLLKLPPSKFDFFDFGEHRRLMEAAKYESEWCAMIVAAADAGLRMGELLALEWSDLDFVMGNFTVRRSNWQGHVGSPKGGKERTIPMTQQLASVLKAHRHLRGKLVFCGPEGEPLTRNRMKKPLWRACRKAGLREVGWHVLRHTFCSHLAMKGAPPKAIQELAGHTSIAVTMRYMHLSPTVLKETVRLLDERDGVVQASGTRTAQEKSRSEKIS